MQDQELIQLRYKLIGHLGVTIVAAVVEQSISIAESYRVYTQERRDRNDPYAFLEFCETRYGAVVYLAGDAHFKRKVKKAEVFNFSEQVI